MTPPVGSPPTVESLRLRVSLVLFVVSVLLSLLFPTLSRTRSCRLLSEEMSSGLICITRSRAESPTRMVVVLLQERSCRVLVVLLRAKVEVILSLASSLARMSVSLLEALSLSIVQTLGRVPRVVLRRVSIRLEIALLFVVPMSLVVVRVSPSTLVPRLLLVKVQASAPHSGTSTQ